MPPEKDKLQAYQRAKQAEQRRKKPIGQPTPDGRNMSGVTDGPIDNAVTEFGNFLANAPHPGVSAGGFAVLKGQELLTEPARAAGYQSGQSGDQASSFALPRASGPTRTPSGFPTGTRGQYYHDPNSVRDIQGRLEPAPVPPPTPRPRQQSPTPSGGTGAAIPPRVLDMLAERQDRRNPTAFAGVLLGSAEGATVEGAGAGRTGAGSFPSVDGQSHFGASGVFVRTAQGTVLLGQGGYAT